MKAIVNGTEVAVLKGEAAWLPLYLNPKALSKLSEGAQHVNIIEITEKYQETH